MGPHTYNLTTDPDFAVHLRVDPDDGHVRNTTVHRIYDRYIGWVHSACDRYFHTEPPRLIRGVQTDDAVRAELADCEYTTERTHVRWCGDCFPDA
jgi:hypothetical protein